MNSGWPRFSWFRQLPTIAIWCALMTNSSTQSYLPLKPDDALMANMNVSLEEAEKRLADLRGLLMGRIARANKIRAELKLSKPDHDPACSASDRHEYAECNYEFRVSYLIAHFLEQTIRHSC